MGKFRKKPVVVEAFRWTGGPDQEAEPDWIVDAIRAEKAAFARHAGRVETHSGWATVFPGDWIIRQIDGEIYPCKPELFAATYEPVED